MIVFLLTHMPAADLWSSVHSAQRSDVSRGAARGPGICCGKFRRTQVTSARSRPQGAVSYRDRSREMRTAKPESRRDYPCNWFVPWPLLGPTLWRVPEKCGVSCVCLSHRSHFGPCLEDAEVGIRVAMITPESVIDANHQNQGEMEMNVLKQLFVDEQGASMAEYALLLALIAVATIGALQVLQGQIVGVFDRVGTAINGALPTP